MSEIAFCACGASLTGRTRFCGECGRPNPRFAAERRDERRAADRELRRRMWVVAFVYTAVLATLFAVASLDLGIEASLATAFGIDAGVGIVAALILGRGGWRHALGRMPDGRALALGLSTPAVTLPIALAWVALAGGLTQTGDAPDEGLGMSLGAALFYVAVLPAVVEEWLCRGVLWDAVRPVTTRNAAILVTAIPFACMHLFNGGWVLELPHRFVLGLVLGWLRARTGSLAPCVLAHFAHNAIAIALDQ